MQFTCFLYPFNVFLDLPSSAFLVNGTLDMEWFLGSLTCLSHVYQLIMELKHAYYQVEEASQNASPSRTSLNPVTMIYLLKKPGN